mmetsp:Transcript_16393/g.29112  ORF Transcript_16393/g.29112 Transcript_16393/m.29112 type:complete len:87 (+) Transcript_16393:279-539(+)
MRSSSFIEKGSPRSRTRGGQHFAAGLLVSRPERSAEWLMLAYLRCKAPGQSWNGAVRMATDQLQSMGCQDRTRSAMAQKLIAALFS